MIEEQVNTLTFLDVGNYGTVQVEFTMTIELSTAGDKHSFNRKSTMMP